MYLGKINSTRCLMHKKETIIETFWKIYFKKLNKNSKYNNYLPDVEGKLLSGGLLSVMGRLCGGGPWPGLSTAS